MKASASGTSSFPRSFHLSDLFLIAKSDRLPLLFFVRIVFRNNAKNFWHPVAVQEFEGQGGLFIEEADPDEAQDVDKGWQIATIDKGGLLCGCQPKNNGKTTQIIPCFF